MELTIEQIEREISRQSTPDSPRWHMVVDAQGEPLMYSPAGARWTKALWYKASLFTEENVPGVAALVSQELAQECRALSLVQYLDALRDKLVRQERAAAGAVIHG